MDDRTDERDALHGPWPTGSEILQAEWPDWQIWRDRRDDGSHGDWCAEKNWMVLRAQTCDDLRELLKKQP
ncbi:hypothetical protein GCM10027570_13420 [Streptomonospora sediminis]